jgi:hypothetical protein
VNPNAQRARATPCFGRGRIDETQPLLASS